ncbi:ABC transporter substrate-binding protein [Pseudorhodobacter sp. E13]|uniref:ABC transporter substrate-binding protein n=1 Tax=Pseudorhodobacter sp. E13 TaxID=2487931 RepID=UPI000F8D5BA0|nr:ABC transporter substrate-binding protein [Pseudorhodobacter sp. E13]RUS63529.1 ABC transporter substrate-binding protein [Pseudorhodobacter sp. E13]
MKKLLLSSAALLVLPIAAFANCPAITMADMGGVAAGAYPGQFDLADYQAAASCSMEMTANPGIEGFNGQIRGNPALPPLAERLPEEPLVVVPYASVGKYGGTLDALSNATEAGTSDFMSIRHVNLVRYADDLETIVPNIAKSWVWNDDYTQLTFTLRKGHKWSDGQPFTSADVKFWYDNLALDPNINEKPKDYVTVGGERMTVDTPDDVTVVFNLPAPKPGLLAHFATHFAQAFQPKHFLGQFHPDVNPDADKLAQEMGFENGYAAIRAYYGNSDWMDTATPMLNSPDLLAKLPADAAPTLESHIVVRETTEGRHFVANPYFHMVDTTGQQLPYINEMDELFANDQEVRLLKLVNGEVDYKTQSLQLSDAPLLLENQEKGGYTIQLKPKIAMQTISFNVTHPDEAKRAVFGDVKFRKAMSEAINRDALNETAYFGQGTLQQYTGFSPLPEYIDPKWKTYAMEYNADGAKAVLDELGLKDVDGDGFRELPNGEPLVINMQFATQGIAGQVVELISQDWANVGIKSTVKEVTPDEYRSSQSSNQLDVGLWEKGQPLGIILGNNELWVPPFENYFAHRSGMLWAEWVDSKGASGVEPPDYVKTLMDDINTLQSTPAGSDEFKAIANRMVASMVENVLFIGTALTPDPIYVNNKLKNVPEFKTASYEYYRTYPYRGAQWYLEE